MFLRENCEISDALASQLQQRMRIGAFSKESLLPIIKVFQPEVWLMSHQILDHLIADECAAGRIAEVYPGFWDVPKKSTLARLRAFLQKRWR